MEEYLKSISQTETVDKDAQVMLRARSKFRKDDAQWGLLESGDYGYEAHGIDVNTRKQSYVRHATDAEIIPFYFRTYLPEESDLGLLLLQRLGAYGVFTAFSRGFEEFLAKQIPDFILDINRVVHSEVLEFLRKGRVKSIRVILHRPPRDLADKLRFLGNRQDIATYVVEAKAKQKSYLRAPAWLEKIRANPTGPAELPTALTDSGAKIRIKVSYGGSTRTMELGDPQNIAPYIDATKEVKTDATGHPVFDAVDSYGQKVVEELLEQLGRA